MKISNEQKDSCVLVSVEGRMDAVTAPEFESACIELAEKGDIDLVVNLENLEYISSAGLRSVLTSAKKLKALGGNLRFCGLSGMVEEVFRISGFQSMFTIVPTFDDIAK
ncbi:MAG: anti-anti-sigma factor [Desulfobacteraceae bacterium 4572_19]|nr:MAG: anti-anti-sigma factor [Desulfobacteraceae bacterium 4572_19]